MLGELSEEELQTSRRLLTLVQDAASVSIDAEDVNGNILARLQSENVFSLAQFHRVIDRLSALVSVRGSVCQ